MFGGRRRRREEELAAKDRWRTARRLVDEDVTVLGEQLTELHVDTLADDLDPVARDHYRRALEHYDQAAHLLAASTSAEDVLAVEQIVADARYHRAAVLAVRDGEPLPERREPCLSDPRHGPSMQDVEWAAPGGAARTIAVCAADARRLSAGEEPLVRLVRVGDRWVPWHFSSATSGTIDAGVQLARGSSHGVHGQQNLAQAYLEQTTDGGSGSTAPSADPLSHPPVTLGGCPRETASGSSRAGWTASCAGTRSCARTSAPRGWRRGTCPVARCWATRPTASTC